LKEIIIGIALSLVILYELIKHMKAEEKIPTKTLMQFLEEADEAYIFAHQARQINPFIKYANSTVCDNILDDIRRHNNDPKLFGTKAYRERKWKIISASSNTVTVQKDLTHKHVKIQRGVQVAIGDDMHEIWKVSIRDKRDFQVIGITM
jgi:hypothetical protein